MDRVRAALIERRIEPLSPAEWAELRASLAAVRPPPPPSRFCHAAKFFHA